MSTKEFNTELIALKDQLFGYAFNLTKNIADAEDLLQETMYKAIKYRDRFQDNTNQKAWAFTIMKNTFINNYRKASRSFNIDTFGEDDNYTSKIDVKHDDISPEANVVEKEIRDSIYGLKEKFKNPFLMYVEGYKYREIAHKLKLNIGTVKSRIFFSRKLLMDNLQDYQYGV